LFPHPPNTDSWRLHIPICRIEAVTARSRGQKVPDADNENPRGAGRAAGYQSIRKLRLARLC
jgi:hypothetical protein